MNNLTNNGIEYNKSYLADKLPKITILLYNKNCMPWIYLHLYDDDKEEAGNAA